MRITPRHLAHRVTTAHAQAAYPFIAEAGLGGRGAYIGRDLSGGSFVFDPQGRIRLFIRHGGGAEILSDVMVTR